MELESIPETPESDAKILMRQTTYTLDECVEMLKTKSLEEAIKNFFGIVEKKDEEGSTNQKIYKLIRETFNS